MPHRFVLGPVIPRQLQVTHWDEGRRIRWTEQDRSSTFKQKHLFPHSEEFLFEPLGDNVTLMTDEVRGSMNVRIPVIGWLIDRFIENVSVKTVVRVQNAHFKKMIEQSALVAATSAR